MILVFGGLRGLGFQRPGTCAHGIGHALMLLYDSDVDKSLVGCGGFPDRVMEFYCTTGVFMELGRHGLPLFAAAACGVFAVFAAVRRD